MFKLIGIFSVVPASQLQRFQFVYSVRVYDNNSATSCQLTAAAAAERFPQHLPLTAQQ